MNSLSESVSQMAQHSGRDLAVIVPTKDRPHKLRTLLDSLCAQTERCGRVIVIDGSDSARPVVDDYVIRVPIEYHVCRPPGQIGQRNMGISLVTNGTPLVASFDDDIVLESDAIAEMISFWNHCDPATAGVSFNVINEAPASRDIARRIFLMTGPIPGRVLKSGAATSNSSVRSDVRAEWLCGGATVWRLDVLRDNLHVGRPVPWAIGEDVFFSYPLSKRYPLYVCAGARVRHEHVFDYRVKSPDRFYGRTRTLSTFYFVQKNRDLSLLAFLWMTAGSILGRSATGLLTMNSEHVRFAAGQVEALMKGLTEYVSGRDVIHALDPHSD